MIKKYPIFYLLFFTLFSQTELLKAEAVNPSLQGQWVLSSIAKNNKDVKDENNPFKISFNFLDATKGNVSIVSPEMQLPPQSFVYSTDKDLKNLTIGPDKQDPSYALMEQTAAALKLNYLLNPVSFKIISLSKTDMVIETEVKDIQSQKIKLKLTLTKN